ncbi:MAG: response regulator transcription factor [Chitinophagales bacterium]|nr:response regulator transcription factor [Chitinophagales bacterium]HNO03192.1 LytTR family DNA-binding domain-containing protein [Chitinophagales bacterium]
MITTLIVEDDPIFRDMLTDMLPKSSVKTNVIESCATVRQAKVAIDHHQPQLILLDVELPDGKGMDLLQHYEEFGTFETIFVTSHDKYAIDAIKKNAADYIVKPVQLDELNHALNKVKKRLDTYSVLIKVDELTSYVEKLKHQNLQEKKIMINTNEGAIFVKVSDIIKLESESNYTILYLDNNKKIIASKTLSVFEAMLEELNFMRIHRSFVINLTKIKNIENEAGCYHVNMSDASRVEVSRRKKKDFFEKIAYHI